LWSTTPSGGVSTDEVTRLRLERTDGLGQVPVISIIDDDASVRTATDRLVRSLGYVAHTFASADEFLRSPQVDTCSCVIADVQMPGMSGLELQDFLRAQGRRLPIIFITAFPEDNVRARAIAAGAVAFLTKPFDGATLIKSLETALATCDGEANR
jgi:FixJ family two-component response regulator